MSSAAFEYADPSLYEKPLERCPLCGSASIGHRFGIRHYHHPFAISRCSACGFQFMNPRFTDRVIAGLYSPGYYTGNADYAYYDERDAEPFARHVWEARLRIIRHYAKCGNFLDIGCAFGGLLGAASPYFSPYGIEISPYAGSEARRRYGDHIHIGTLADHPFPDGFFSVITMIEVLEHCADPVSVIRACFRLLAPGGLLVLQTANMDGLQARWQGDRYAYYMPGHLSYFSKANLADCLHNTGFSRTRAWHPVEFGLLPKLLKSRYSFTSPADYRRWLRIAWYHYISKIRLGNRCLTSSLVLYAVK